MKMIRKGSWALSLTFLALLAIPLVHFLRGSGEPDLCQLCERPIHHQTAFSAVLGGRKVWACCARCGLSFFRSGQEVLSAEATDYATGNTVSAEKCVYVEGSLVAPCCSASVIIVGEKTSCGKCFDRCYPSVIAFASPEAAYSFSREHGGRIVSFGTLTREVPAP
jgi:hypothetical protein